MANLSYAKIDTHSSWVWWWQFVLPVIDCITDSIMYNIYCELRTTNQMAAHIYHHSFYQNQCLHV